MPHFANSLGNRRTGSGGPHGDQAKLAMLTDPNRKLAVRFAYCQHADELEQASELRFA